MSIGQLGDSNHSFAVRCIKFILANVLNYSERECYITINSNIPWLCLNQDPACLYTGRAYIVSDSYFEVIYATRPSVAIPEWRKWDKKKHWDGDKGFKSTCNTLSPRNIISLRTSRTIRSWISNQRSPSPPPPPALRWIFHTVLVLSRVVPATDSWVTLAKRS